MRRRAQRCGDLGGSSCGDDLVCCRSDGQRVWMIAALCMNVPRFSLFRDNLHLHTHALYANAAAQQCSMHAHQIIKPPACASK